MSRQGRPARPGPSLEVLFDPGSVTIVGASADPAKWGHILSRRALDSCGARPVLLVNRRGVDVCGAPTHPSIAAAREHHGRPLDLVLLCVPASQVLGSVEAAVAAGARALVVISAGLSETGPAGREVERQAVRMARDAGAVLLGPNCLGVVDTGASLQLGHDLLPAGDVTLLSQSGNLVLDLAALLADRGLGVARFASLGNQADLSVVDLMRACVPHERTRAVAAYVEDVGDGRGFVAAARDLVAAGKPVVVLAPGRSAAAIRSAVSHTGSLTSASQVVDAACAAAGAHRVENQTQLADLLVGLLAGRRMPGRCAAVLTDGGGHGAVASDALAAVGLSTPVLGEPTRAALRHRLGDGSSVSNPVDLAGAGEQDPMRYVDALGQLLAAGEVDGVLVTGYFGSYSTQATELAALEVAAGHALADLVTGQAKPVVVQAIHPAGPTGEVLRAAGIPVHRDVDRAAAVLAGLVEGPVGDDLTLPPPAAPLAEATYDEARRLFAGAGIAFPAGRTVHDPVELEAALGELSHPVVLKALGRVHKSEGGGVVLGLPDAAATRSAYAVMVEALDPPAVSVEAMADLGEGVEVVVGCVQDPRFGPVLMVGLGGVLTEVLADTALALAPASPATAKRLLLSLRGAAVLHGVRGRDAVDLDALAALVSQVSRVAAAHPELAELELNPVLATPSGAVALDARVVLGQDDSTSRR